MCEQHEFDRMLEQDEQVERQQEADLVDTYIDFRTRERNEHFHRSETPTSEQCWSDGELRTKGNRPMRPVPNTPGGISQPQYGFIIDLYHEKNLLAAPSFFDRVNAMDASEFDEYMHWLINRTREVTRVKASEMIENLLKLPRKPAEEKVVRDADPGLSHERITVHYEEVETDRGVRRTGVLKGGTHDVLAGRYALDTTNDQTFANDITFFKVWVGDRGGWKVRMYRSDEQVELSFRTQVAIVRRIAQDPLKALALWGAHKSSCGVCGRKLTNDASRALGIGPICASKWSY